MKIPVFYGCNCDLTKIDLAFLNMKILPLTGRNFKNFLNKISLRHIPWFIDEIVNDKEYRLPEVGVCCRYAIIPLDINGNFDSDNWNHFQALMVILFPSDFTLITEYHFEPYDDGFHHFGGSSHWEFNPSGDRFYDNMLIMVPNEYAFVRKFISTYFESSKTSAPLKHMIDLYAASLDEFVLKYKFLNLIMCFEIILPGNYMLNYRLKRSIGLICGDNEHYCNIIMQNFNKIYDLRSDIVHGNLKVKYDNLKPYTNYCIFLLGKLLRELIVHKYNNIDEFASRVTKAGFGQKSKLSDNYKALKHPILSNTPIRRPL
ncbi:MAG: hypothetical protein WC716_09520 [Chitinophagaceae bacterium]|jgi:hypothetical protein